MFGYYIKQNVSTELTHCGIYFQKADVATSASNSLKVQIWVSRSYIASDQISLSVINIKTIIYYSYKFIIISDEANWLSQIVANLIIFLETNAKKMCVGTYF